MVDELDESAKRYESVNCVANKNGKLIGYNTDCDGFTMSVRDYPMDGKVLLIGATMTIERERELFGKKVKTDERAGTHN